MAKVRILVFLLTVIVLATVGSVVILYARGYRLGVDEDELSLSPRGLLVANSDPNGAQVFVDSELKTATNNTVSLAPNTYDVEVKKEGFLPWKKRIVIEREVVTQIDAFLLLSAPSLSPLTYSGIFNPVFASDYGKIAYGVPVTLDDAERGGLWVLETVNLPLGFNRDPRQITDGDLSTATWEWSPDGREILLTTESGTFLLDAGRFTPQISRLNVTAELEDIKAEWDLKRQKLRESQFARLDDSIENVFVAHATDVRFSPDENRILYTASGSATIPEGIVRQLPGASTQHQERELADTKSYVYDIKEDRNFPVGEPEELLSWLPNSLNLLLSLEDRIVVMDYDGTNRQTVLTGNYVFPHAYPSTNANRVLILTNLGALDGLPNLYWLSLK